MGMPLSLGTVVLAAPIAGIVGGMPGGLFARALPAITKARREAKDPITARSLLLAGLCGLVVAVLGVVTHGATWGTGYAPVRALLSGQGGSDWLGPVKFAAMLAGYFTGVVRAPLTGVIIRSETTGSGNAILPLLTTALIADQVGARVCRERLYHALAKDFRHKPSPPPNADEP